MTIVVVGCGRSGTNLVLEILRGNSKLKASKDPENKTFFTSYKKHPADYLTKCDTCYFRPTDLDATMQLNPLLSMLWTIRDPRDMILSKIRRGQPKKLGGDCKRVAADATPQGCMQDLKHMLKCCQFSQKHFPRHMRVVKMEAVISDLEGTIKKMCDFLSLPFQVEMLDFIPRMRNVSKKKRYKVLDKSQIGLWKQWRTVYDGFFLEHEYPIEEMFEEVKPLARQFGY